MKKRAQVTLFVIIGAVLLLAAGMFFYINNELSEDRPTIDIPDVSLEVRPARELIETCLEVTATQALERIGSQGGYISVNNINPVPYESSAVEFTPNYVPYWRYLDTTNCGSHGCEQSRQPPLCKRNSDCDPSIRRGENSIEEQVETYIETNILTCINDFEILKNQYEIAVEEEPDITVFFNNGATRFVLNYPLTLTSLTTSNTETIERFTIELDIDLINMYKYADNFIKFVKESNYYETQTMNLINIYAQKDGDLPPTSDIDFFSPGSKIYIRTNIENILRYDILPLIGLTGVIESRNYRPLVEYADYGNYTQYSTGIYTTFTAKTESSIKPYKYNVNHHYLYQPIYLSINDGSEIIKPEKISPGGFIGEFVSFAVKDYRFRYDVAYPLVININDDQALNGKGFDFNFGIEVNVKNNVPAYNNFTELAGQEYSLPSIGDIEQYLDQSITILTQDKYSGEPLPGVTISYACGDREYEIGATQIDFTGRAVLETTLPFCLGGFVVYEKHGYYGEYEAYDNLPEGTDARFTFDLWPVVEKEVILYRRSPQDIADIQNSGTGGFLASFSAFSNLTTNHTAFINVEKHGQTVFNSEIPTIPFLGFGMDQLDEQPNYAALEESIWTSYEEGQITAIERDNFLDDLTSVKLANPTSVEFTEGEFVVQEGINTTGTLQLVPGDYTFQTTLLDNKGIFVPAETREICVLGGSVVCLDKETIHLPEQNITTWPTGGGLFNATITSSFLYESDDPIILYALEIALPRNWTAFENTPQLEEYQVGREQLLVKNIDLIN